MLNLIEDTRDRYPLHAKTTKAVTVVSVILHTSPEEDISLCEITPRFIRTESGYLPLSHYNRIKMWCSYLGGFPGEANSACIVWSDRTLLNVTTRFWRSMVILSMVIDAGLYFLSASRLNT